MPRVTGPLLSINASGTIAGAVILQPRPGGVGSPQACARSSPKLRFHRKGPTPPATTAQTNARDSLASATAYAKAPPAPDLPAIEALARARNLPLYQAASAYYFTLPAAPAGTPWDGGASTWDGGGSTWD